MPQESTPSEKTAADYDSLVQRTEAVQQSLAKLGGLQKAKEQEVQKILTDANCKTVEEYLQKAEEEEARYSTLLTQWQAELDKLEPIVEEVSRELHL